MCKSKDFVIFFLIYLFSANFISTLHSNSLAVYKNDIKNSQNQEESWATVLHENYIFGTGLRIVNNKTIYFVGELERYNTYITSYNSTGKKLWEYIWRREENTRPCDFIIDSENYLYITGTISNSSTYGGDIFLLKFNASGQLIWSKIFNPYTRCRSISMKLDLDKSLYISGHDYYYDNGPISNVFLIKMNDSGNVLWDRVINMSGNIPDIIEMHIDSELNVLLYIGTSFSSQHLIKFNNSGSTIWNKEWGEEDGFGRSRVILHDDILVTGITYYQNNNTYDAWIMKINSSGFTVITKKIGNYHFSCDSIWHYDDLNNTYFLISHYSDGIFLFKFNSNLSYTWNSSLNYYIQEIIYSMMVQCDSQQNINLIFTINLFSKNSDIFLIKLNRSGTVLNNFSWGGSNRDSIDHVYIDSQDNLYFTCFSEYINHWDISRDYTILVKNPKPNGNPPKIDYGINQLDIMIFTVLVVTSLISLGCILSIVFPYLKKQIRRKERY
ncbi:MAG: hypothetical protein ACW96S_01685 [Promethearchaeota archaeon]|jgi:hypothetical protein